MSAGSAPVIDHQRARPLWVPFAGLAALVVVVDQATKALVVAALATRPTIPLVGDYLRLIYTKNAGAVFGLFQDRAVLFGLVSLVVIAAIVGFHWRSGRSPYLTLTLGLLLGGAIGNLIDRLRLGYVVDFVDAGVGTVRFYTFNVADASISAAVLLLVLVSLRPSLASVGSDGRASDG